MNNIPKSKQDIKKQNRKRTKKVRKQVNRILYERKPYLDPATECLINYAKALVNPFDRSITSVCRPSLEPTKSHKFAVYQSVTATCSNTTGWGYVMVKPVPSNGENNLYYTSSYYTGDDTTAPERTGTGIGGSAPSQCPYGTSAFSSGENMWRLVGVGVRVRNISTQLSKNGYILGLVASDHIQDFTSVYTAEPRNVLQNRYCIKRSAHQNTNISYFPTTGDTIWHTGIDVNAKILIHFYCDSGNLQSYDVEVITYYEVIGRLESGMQTPTEGVNLSMSNSLKSYINSLQGITPSLESVVSALEQSFKIAGLYSQYNLNKSYIRNQLRLEL